VQANLSLNMSLETEFKHPFGFWQHLCGLSSGKVQWTSRTCVHMQR